MTATAPRRKPAAIGCAALSILLANADAAFAQPPPPDWPCKGCLAAMPGGAAPVPLLVLLHGDGESASSVLEGWRSAAAARRVALLALACPAAEHCAGSWWRWNGSPDWVTQQVSAVEERYAIDPQRLWIAGWSGGASYIGLRTQEFEERFSAIVIHGGGIPPQIEGCPRAPARVYFLVGDANPLHWLAERLRDHYAACGQDVTWRLLAHAAHQGEWQALAPNAGAIVDWLASTPPRVAGH